MIILRTEHIKTSYEYLHRLSIVPKAQSISCYKCSQSNTLLKKTVLESFRFQKLFILSILSREGYFTPKFFMLNINNINFLKDQSKNVIREI